MVRAMKKLIGERQSRIQVKRFFHAGASKMGMMMLVARRMARVWRVAESGQGVHQKQRPKRVRVKRLMRVR
jgi:hypothetical protein